ncbi:MAG: hypothetical protein K8S87_02695 [Planctomycetes bacterium]|nr:hypothetical protein [Planctomycetota bacterium]
MTQKKEKKENCASGSSTNQFYHSGNEEVRDTDSFVSREDDDRFRPLLIEHLKRNISQGKFDVSRDEVLKIIKKAADDVEANLDDNKKKKD